jgi:hypothetical protein
LWPEGLRSKLLDKKRSLLLRFLLGNASEPMTGAIVDQAQAVIGTFG